MQEGRQKCFSIAVGARQNQTCSSQHARACQHASLHAAPEQGGMYTSRFAEPWEHVECCSLLPRYMGERETDKREREKERKKEGRKEGKKERQKERERDREREREREKERKK
jgi:hypothetical protein